MRSIHQTVPGPKWLFTKRVEITTALLLLAAIGWLIRGRIDNPSVAFDLPSIQNGTLPKSNDFPILQARRVAAPAFLDGEVLHYKVKFKGMTVGNAVLSAEPGDQWNGRSTVKLVATARSTRLFDRFFRVRDRTVSVVDRASFSTLTFEQRLREGSRHIERSLAMDYRDNRFTGRESTYGKNAPWKGAIDSPLNDALSAFFYVRTLPIKPGSVHTVSAVNGGRVTSLRIEVGPTPRKIKTPAGTFEAVPLTPDLEGDTIFGSKGGALTVWVTNDARRMPVLMDAKISVGQVRVLLNRTEPAAPSSTRPQS